MITREFQKGDAQSTALYSDCERYRYALTRVWQPAAPKVLFIMLNPSKATERQNDPTIERCERRARALGFGGFRATNIFAWRETDPKAMRRVADPVGPDNDAVLQQGCTWADQIIAGWGSHGDHRDQGTHVAQLLRRSGRPIHVLGLTKAGQPRHPLYIAYRQQPEAWSIPS